MKKLLFTLVFLICLYSSIHAESEVSELKNKVCKELPNIDGWCSKEKALNFIDLVLQTKPDVCVEIGVFGGASIFPVASALKFLRKGVVIGIDSWDRFECIKYCDPIDEKEHLEWWAKINLKSIYEAYLHMLNKFELEEVCITMKTTSEKAAADIDIIDILFIDGNHSEIPSMQDVMLYLPKVHSGGYIWMGDASSWTTQMAIDLLLESCDVIKLIDNGNCILFKKR